MSRERKSPGQEGYWSDLADRAADDDLDDATEGETVRDLVVDALGGVETVHSVTATLRSDGTVYLVVAYSTTMDSVDTAPDLDVPIVDVRTVAVDLDTETVTATDNGLWVPADAGVLDALTRGVARATSDAGTDDPPAPARTAPDDVDVDVDRVLARRFDTEGREGQHTDRMTREPGISAGRSWGYGAGPPSEVERFVGRLREAGLDEDEHLTRLKWGAKEPMDRVTRPLSELTGNYGVETLPRDSGLVMVDVDYPERFPDDDVVDLPETLAVSSPHGDDERRHLIFLCSEKERLAAEVGGWAVQSVAWGDLWIGDRYVVGPGSQLSAYGCDDGDNSAGDEGACPRCSDPDGGYYRFETDAPIAEVEADDVLELLDGSDGYDVRDAPSTPEPPEPVDDVEAELADDEVRCANCSEVRPVDETKTVEVLDEERHICRGGCE